MKEIKKQNKELGFCGFLSLGNCLFEIDIDMSSKTMRSSSLSKRPSLMTSLPDELVVDIIAHVPRSYYPTISLVSRRFRSIVASSELYSRRSLLGCTERCLYALLYDGHNLRLYILKSNGSFVLIPSLPPMPSFASFVAVGSKIYVVGGLDRSTSGWPVTSSAFTIDCRFHTVQSIPDILKPMAHTVAEIIDGKIYVIEPKSVMVFDTETQTWEPVTTKPEIKLNGSLWRGGVVMPDKIYFRDCENSFVYSVKENKWETDPILNSMKWRHACVIDDILYYYDPHENKLRGYDTKHKCWRVVKGVERLLPEPSRSWWATVSNGEKLVLFVSSHVENEIRFARIALERSQGGEIWGKVEWCHVHVFGGRLFGRPNCSVIVL